MAREASFGDSGFQQFRDLLFVGGGGGRVRI